MILTVNVELGPSEMEALYDKENPSRQKNLAGNIVDMLTTKFPKNCVINLQESAGDVFLTMAKNAYTFVLCEVDGQEIVYRRPYTSKLTAEILWRWIHEVDPADHFDY